MTPALLDGDPRIRRRWVIGIGLFAATWFVLLWPLANALFGLPGEAADNKVQGDRLIYEEVVKLVLVLGVAAFAAWVGAMTLRSRTFPPVGLRVPVRMSINRGMAALWPGLGLLLAALIALGFRIESLRVTLKLANALRQIG